MKRILTALACSYAFAMACNAQMTAAQKMAFGDVMANPKMEFGGLTFTALSANSGVSMFSKGSAPIVSLETSSDGINWSPFVVGATTNVLANVGDKIYFRAGSSGNTGFATSGANYNAFAMSGTIAASGNVMSLLSRDFDNSTSMNSQYCFGSLFRGCTSLASAPQLPATVLATYCYYLMFYGCTSLASAPQLPATVLTDGCYRQMFRGCTSLASAPQLPATVLGVSCYSEMFDGCVSLTDAPALPATAMANYCYRYMFRDCTSLASVQCSFTTWGTETTDWMSGVGSTGTRTFTKPAALPTEYGTSKIPDGWTVIDL